MVIKLNNHKIIYNLAIILTLLSLYVYFMMLNLPLPKARSNLCTIFDQIGFKIIQ